jgi:hypothetical protein
MTVRPASPAERALVRAAARFVAARGLAGQPLLIALALISRNFLGISLRSALAAYVFNRLLVAEKEPRSLPYRAQNGNGAAA